MSCVSRVIAGQKSRVHWERRPAFEKQCQNEPEKFGTFYAVRVFAKELNKKRGSYDTSK